MKVRFILFDEESLQSNNDIDLTVIERNNNSIMGYTLFEAKVNSTNDIVIVSGGVKKCIATTIDKGTHLEAIQYKIVGIV